MSGGSALSLTKAIGNKRSTAYGRGGWYDNDGGAGE